MHQNLQVIPIGQSVVSNHTHHIIAILLDDDFIRRLLTDLFIKAFDIVDCM
jgi:hypothetical protein